MTETVRYLIASFVLWLVMSGHITSADQLPGTVNPNKQQQLAGVMMKENGSSKDDRTVMLTGAVVINRVNSPNWDGDTIEEVVMAKDHGYWQYWSGTRNNFKTVKCSERCMLYAKYLLLYGTGAVCPPNVMYQSQNSRNGSKIYYQKNGEYFAYE